MIRLKQAPSMEFAPPKPDNRRNRGNDLFREAAPALVHPLTQPACTAGPENSGATHIQAHFRFFTRVSNKILADSENSGELCYKIIQTYL